MSYRVKTRTPVIDIECLIMAIKDNNCKYTQHGEDFAIGNIRYEKRNTHYKVSYYGDHNSEAKLVDSIEKSYLKFYKQKMERLEQERIERKLKEEQERLERFKEEQKKQIIEKAKKQGYQVKEVKKGDKIQLVCVRYK